MNNEDCLIASYLLDGKGGGKAMDWQAISQWTANQGLLWVHLDYTQPEADQWLENDSGLDPMVVSALISDDPRPRSSVMLDGMLIILRGVNLNPGADAEDMVSIRMWITESRIISTRRRRLLSVSDIRGTIESGDGPATSGEFLVQVCDRIMQRMADVISDVDDRVDLLEDEVVAEKNHQIRTKIAEIRRESIGLRRYLAPQRESMTRLYSEKVAWLTDMDRLRLREVADSTMRYIEDLDAAREKAVVIQEELISGLSEQMDKRMYVLSIVAAIFLPLGFLTGLLGINVGGIPGAEYKDAFIVFCIMLVLVVGGQVWLFKKMKWM